MLDWLKYPFLRFVIAFMLGILIADYIDISNEFLVSFGILIVLVIVLLRTLFRRKFFSLNPVIGLAFLFLVFFLGMLRTTLYKNENSKMCFDENTEMYTGTIVSSPEFTGKFYKVNVKINEVFNGGTWGSCRGKVLVYFSKPIEYGVKLMIASTPSVIPKPANPLEFDYRKYMLHKNIRYRQFLSPENYTEFDKTTPSIIQKWGNTIRSSGVEDINWAIPDSDANGIAKALLLGVRSDITSELRDTYAHAGVIHILAISGLHLGILYGVLLIVFRRFKKSLGFVALAFVVLWSYALVAGLPPSVTRAALMFSVLSLGQYFYKTPNIFNTISLSAFILLFINPFQLYDIGFQLSYLAVLGIVILFPAINGLFVSKYKIVESIWSLTSVGIAAQVFTFPVVIYYFHNFPLLFFISNLIIIPLATVVLIGGLLLLLTMQFGWSAIGGVLGSILEIIIEFMNKSVTFIENIPGSFINDIYLDTYQVLLLFIILIGMLVFFFHKNLKGLLLAFFIWILLLTSFTIVELNRSNRHILALYRIANVSAIDIFNGPKIRSYINNDRGEREDISYNVSNFRLKNTGSTNATPLVYSSIDLPGMLAIVNNRSLLLLSKPIRKDRRIIEPLQVNYLVISNNAIKDFSEFGKRFDSDVVLFDTSNDFWYAKWAEKLLKTQNINCHNAWQEGAYIAKL